MTVTQLFTLFIASLALVQASCPAPLSSCGPACYVASQYCCVNGRVTQLSHCPESHKPAPPHGGPTPPQGGPTPPQGSPAPPQGGPTPPSPPVPAPISTTSQVQAALSTSQAQKVPSTTSKALIDPSTSQAQAAPSTSQVQAAPSTSQVQAAPSTSQVQAAPSTTFAVQPPTSQAQVAPSTTSQVAQPSTTVPVQAPSTNNVVPSTTSQAQAVATTGSPVVNPTPVANKNPNDCAAGQSSCAGQCYDPLTFGCSSDANGNQQFLCPAVQPSAQSTFWVETIPHQGTAAFLGDSSYVVYRNVKDFGAKGDGVTDDTAAINSAITAYGRCGMGCDSTTTRPAVVYFPAGTYVISAPIIQYYYTQLIGNPNDMPRILAASSFKGMAMVDSDPYSSNGNWYTNQNNFYRQIRNFIFDTTQTSSGSATTCIHWQVAQATSLTNLVFRMTPGSAHQGVWMENGSGGWMSDLVFYGGGFALWVGNQQFTSRNITIYGSTTGVYMNWNWGWTFKSLFISGSQIGLDMTSLGDQGQQLVGSVVLLDVQIENTIVGIKTGTGNSASTATSNSLLIDNAYFTNVGTAVATSSGSALVAGNSQGEVYIPTWGQGHVYKQASASNAYSGFLPQTKRPAALLDARQNNNFYFEKPKPQYENYDVSAFVSVKNEGAYGDGVHDDTVAIQTTLYKYAGCRIIYFPAGSYIISSTVVVPAGSRIVGEAWSSLMAKGQAFQDPKNPIPMLQVGNPGDVGVAELSDLLFTAQGPQPGAILVQWNIQDPQGAQGSAGMWDCHFRIGGAAGTNQQIATCPKYQPPTAECMGTFMLMHVTSSASAYMENVWEWTADHDLDAFGADMSGQISVYNGRGLLIESTSGAWLYGTAVEHSWFYQYQLVGAENVLMAMIQTETPYYQAPPYNAPWETNSIYNDPSFSDCPVGAPSCEMAWGMRYIETDYVYLYGAGHYNFFQYYNQTCLDTEDCQQAMVEIVSNDASSMYLYGLNTKASVSMIETNGQTMAKAVDNVNTFCSTIHYLTNAQGR